MIDPRTPILVTCGQITDTTGKPSSERANVVFCAEAAPLALADARASIATEALGRKLDAVAVLEFFPDVSPRFASPFGRCTNPPKSVATRLNAAPRQLIYTHQAATRPSTWSTASPRRLPMARPHGVEPVLLADMLTREQLGRKVTVSGKDGRNVVQPT